MPEQTPAGYLRGLDSILPGTTGRISEPDPEDWTPDWDVPFTITDSQPTDE